MAQIEAHIGDVSGGSQVAVGNYIVQIGRVEGGVVNILNEAPPPPRIRPQPVLLRPKVFPGLLDRQTETATALNALNSQQSVECTGQPGAGRTSLLRHLAHQPQLATVFPAGIIYFQVNQQSAADLLKSLFDAFYICDFPIKPNETEMRHYLQSVNALVLLDDVEIGAQQIDYLMNIAPNCMFVAVTRERRLSSDVVEVSVKGLPTADAVLLYEKELGRPLWSEEESKARSICEAVDCIPLLVVREAHKSRESSTDEEKVLAALSVFSGTSVAAEHVAAIAGLQNVQPTLADLEERGLVQSHEQHYAVAPEVQQEEPDDLKPWFTRALNYFVNWTEQHHNDHKLIAASGEAILLLLKQAVDVQSWGAVRNLGHACEEALTVTGKWDMWANVLDSIEIAGKAQGDIAERAWVLHQLGTRALCLGERFEAEAALRDALGLRERLGDASGAAITRHNLDILLGLLPLDSDGGDSDVNTGAGTESTSVWLKIGVVAFVGLSVLIAIVAWRYLSSRQTAGPPRIVSFDFKYAMFSETGKDQLCYEVENAERVLIEPDIGERKPATKECLDITYPHLAVTYTLTAFAADGSSTSLMVGFGPGPSAEPSVETSPMVGPSPIETGTAGPSPVDTGTVAPSPVETGTAEPQLKHARIVLFEVSRPRIKQGESINLCYGVADAKTTTISPFGRRFPNVERNCFDDSPKASTKYVLETTGEDNKTESRDLTVIVSEPVQRVRIVRFEINRRRQLCYALENARRADIQPGIGALNNLTTDCLKLPSLERQTYTLTATGADGKTEMKTVTYTPPEPPKENPIGILFFKGPEQPIKPGAQAKLCYGTLGEGTATISPQPGSVRPLPFNCVNVFPRTTTEYTLTVAPRQGEKKSKTIKVTVEGPNIQ